MSVNRWGRQRTDAVLKLSTYLNRWQKNWVTKNLCMLVHLTTFFSRRFCRLLLNINRQPLNSISFVVARSHSTGGVVLSGSDIADRLSLPSVEPSVSMLL